MEVAFRDRLDEEPMAAAVSVEKSVRLVLKDDRLELVPGFTSDGQWKEKLSFDLSRLDEDGLYDPENRSGTALCSGHRRMFFRMTVFNNSHQIAGGKL